MGTRTSSRTFVFAASLIFAASPALGAGGSGALPSVSTVQARFAQALGGVTAIKAPKTMTIHGAYVAGAKTAIPFVIYLGDFKRLEIDTVGTQQYRSGYDGTTAWTLDPGKPPQILTGNDALSARRDADLYYWSRIPTYFRSMNVVGVERFAGHQCYHIRGTTNWGNVNNQYFDVTSGLLVGYMFHQYNGGAPEKAETRQMFDRYSKVRGLLVPMRQTAYRNGTLQVVTQYRSVSFDDVDPSVFVPPASVRKAVNPS